MDFLDEELKERVVKGSEELGFAPVFYDKAKEIAAFGILRPTESFR